MTSNILVALRFLTANKRSMAMSLTGIVFGVGFFIFSQAQTSGFEQFFIKTVLGTNRRHPGAGQDPGHVFNYGNG